MQGGLTTKGLNDGCGWLQCLMLLREPWTSKAAALRVWERGAERRHQIVMQADVYLGAQLTRDCTLV